MVLSAVGPVDAGAPLARVSGGVESKALESGLSVASRTARISLAADGVAGAWMPRRDGALRPTSFGHEAVVFRRGETEELLAVQQRLGTHTWRWELQSGALTPRLGADGAISFRGGHRLAPLAIAPPVVLDGAGRDVTPAGLRWSLEQKQNRWWLALRLDDTRLPLPYVIDPTVTHRGSVATNNGAAGATSIALTMPTGFLPRDLLVAELAVRGGTDVTVTPPDGWTQALNATDTTLLRQVTYYHVAAAGDPASATFTFSGTAPTQQAVGGVSAFYGMKTTSLVDAFSSAAANGTSTSASAPAITTQAPGSLLLGAFASATGTTFSTASGMSERVDAQSASATATLRASVALDSSTVAAAGSTGAKSVTIASSHWLAHLLSFRADDVAPEAPMNDPGPILRGTVTFVSVASDADSGVARVQFQRAVAGSGSWVNAGSAVTVAPYQRAFNTSSIADGLYDFRAVVTDNAANVTNSAAFAGVRVDNTLPTSTTTFPASSGVYGATAWSTGCATAGLCGTVADAGSGLQLVDLSFRRSSGGLYWNGSSFASTTEVFNPVSVSSGNWSFPFSSASFPATGSYVLKLRATDNAGNVATFSRTFTYDLTAPNTTITSTQPASTNATSISITFTSSEGGSSFECQLDGAAYQPCTSPKTYSGLADGVHQFAVRATDPSGNTDATPAATSWRVDTHAPAITLTAPVAGATVSSTVTGTATASDDVAVVGVQFAVDGVALGAEDKTAPYTVSWNTRLTTTGLHTVSALARDAAGNTASAQAQVRVDNNGVRGPGLLAAYSFDEGQGGTASDASGNGRTGTMVGAGWTSGKNGSAVFLDGVDDRVDLPQLGTFYRTAFTFEGWVLKRGTRKDVTVMGSWDGGGPMIWVDNANGRYMLTLGADSANYLDSGRTPAVGSWQHVAGTWDGATARLYLDGVQVASRTFAGDIGTADVWRIGAFRSNPIGFFDGLVDDVRIYNRALPASEIQGDMSSSVGPTDVIPPSAPADLALVSRTNTSVDLSWSASTDNLGVAGYNVYRDGTLVSSPTAHSATVSGLTCGTSYVFAVEAFDVAGNVSSRSSVTASTATCDTTPPLVALASPLDGSFVGGLTIVSATASDDGSVASVQFRIDGVDLGPPDTTAPYTIAWNTTLVANGPHIVTAVARDAAGNTATATANVTVDNSSAPGPGLVAGYGFDEGQGTGAGDGSGDANTGVLAGGASWGAGEHGTAVVLDGSSGRVDLPALGTFYRSGFTFEAWVLKSSAKKDVAIVGTWDGGGPMLWVDHINGHYMLTIGTNFGDYLDSGVSPAVGTWQHVAATYDGSVARLFVDGSQIASKTVTTDIGSSNVWRIGAYRSSPTGFFDGSIDDVRIYNRALSVGEIQADLTTAAPSDDYPPTVESTSPENDASGVPGGASMQATFSESIDPVTVNASTFVLRTSGGTMVPAAVTYSQATRTATLTPTDALARGTHYTVSLSGGTGGVADLAGNPLRSTVSWTFSTMPAPQPILVVGSSANPFSSYSRELLQAEGLDEYETLDVSQLSATAIDGFDVIVLGQVPLTASQVALLTTWVQDGGNLIAFRPDKQLAGLLGLTDLGSTLAEGYLRVDTSSEPGAGIVGQTMQFHGSADLYTLSGARAVATLYSDASTSTPSPAVTVRDVGSAGGHAAAFTFDLARSIVYTRQGNPAWAGQERDGAVGIRPNDLFYGGSASDPQPDWVDLSKLAIPQADEQQRLLANLITFTARDRKPLPRFWYFPRDVKAAIVMTLDDHGGNGSSGRFDQLAAASRPGCSVVDWECVRGTSYTFTSTPMTDAQAKAYTDAGFEVALHTSVNNGCGDWTLASAQQIFTTQLAAFASKFPSLPAPSTNRTHCVTWDDWFTEPTAEAAHGIRLDTNYYAYPASWIANTPGFMTGSGIPMRFANVDGSTVDVYQAMTQMDDEAGQPYPATANALLDRALGPEGYYGFFVANMHADVPVSPESDAIVAAAQARNVPIITSKQLLDWTDARNASSFGSLSWAGNVLSFAIHADAGARGLRAMLPVQAHGGTLTALASGGASVAYTTQVVKGVQYAVFAAASGTYTATYG